MIGVGIGLLNIHSAVQDERVVSHRGSTELSLGESSGEVSLSVGEAYHLLIASHVEHLEVPVHDNHNVTLNLIAVDDMDKGPLASQWGVRDFRNVLRRRSLLQTLRDSREAILLHLTLRGQPQGGGLLRDTVDEVWNRRRDESHKLPYKATHYAPVSIQDVVVSRVSLKLTENCTGASFILLGEIP